MESIYAMPIAIMSHQKYLRDLAEPALEGAIIHPRREALVLRVSRWLKGHRPRIDDVASAPAIEPATR